MKVYYIILCLTFCGLAVYQLHKFNTGESDLLSCFWIVIDFIAIIFYLGKLTN